LSDQTKNVWSFAFQIEERGKETHNVRLQFKAIEVGWETDLDGNRHPNIRIARRNWSAVLYDHPAESWQVIALEIARKDKRGVRLEEYAGAEAERRFSQLIEGELTFADSALDAIADDLYEFGRKNAAKRWVNKTVALSRQNRSDQEAR
jgi:hypothetical protein